MKYTLLLVHVCLIVCITSDGPFVTNDTKTVSLSDPNVDPAVKSALENGSVSEVLVRKDLLLFPVNAPDLVS